jgi:hypothetical protein
LTQIEQSGFIKKLIIQEENFIISVLILKLRKARRSIQILILLLVPIFGAWIVEAIEYFAGDKK